MEGGDGGAGDLEGEENANLEGKEVGDLEGLEIWKWEGGVRDLELKVA